MDHARHDSAAPAARTQVKMAATRAAAAASASQARTAAASSLFGIGPVVHEMRNFLAPMHSAIDLLRHQGGGNEAAATIDLLERQTRGLDRLVSDLLDVSRLATGKLQLRAQPCALDDIAASALDICRPAADARSQRLLLVPAPHPVHLEADPLRLCQAIVNLVFNAVRYSPEGGTIRVELASDERHAVVRVRDDGPGIHLANRDRAFELGAQATDGDGGGLGIGLYLVRCIAQLHGGTAEAWSAGADRGSTFTIRIPLRGGCRLADWS